MKKTFTALIAPVMVFALGAIFGFMTLGCEQSEGVIQNVQNVTPVASDFSINGLTAIADGSPKAVSIKPKTGKSQGIITIYYEGTNGSVYPKSVNAPSEAGKYAVTFDVAEAEGFNEANGLKAGTLIISEKKAGNIENEDGDYTDDDNNEETIEKLTEEKPEKITGGKDNETNEEKNEPFIHVDFEDVAWNGNGYAKRTVNWGGYKWAVSGVVKSGNNSDRKEGNKSIRLRGNASDSGDNANRIELIDYLTRGIESISFDYASYGSHKGGTIILYYQKENENWEEVDRIIGIPSWNAGGSQILNAKFEINITGNVRFKIEKVNALSDTSVNIDNIIITYLQ